MGETTHPARVEGMSNPTEADASQEFSFVNARSAH